MTELVGLLGAVGLVGLIVTYARRYRAHHREHTLAEHVRRINAPEWWE